MKIDIVYYNEPPTQNQLDYIESMQEFVSEKFEGKTKQEASEYIDRNKEEFDLVSIPNWTLEHGYF